MTVQSANDSAGPAGAHTQLFASLINQLAHMALTCLGSVPSPETGQMVRDLEAARLFIDQLEMLEAKTRGNLDVREAALLKQCLTTVRLAFVEAVNHPEPAATSSSPAEKTAAPAADDESRKKFTKKY